MITKMLMTSVLQQPCSTHSSQVRGSTAANRGKMDVIRIWYVLSGGKVNICVGMVQRLRVPIAVTRHKNGGGHAKHEINNYPVRVGRTK
jgi:hypothetical protein